MNSHHGLRISAIVMLLLFSLGPREGLLAVSTQDSANPKIAESKTVQSPDISKWKSYRNEKYGFEVKYPATWAAHSGSGSGAEIITLAGPFSGSERPSLNLMIQPNMNPRKLSINEWSADQLRRLKTKPENTGQLTIGSQPAIFMENTNSFGKQRDTFTLLHKTDVLSFRYKSDTAEDPTYVAIVQSFRILK
jgi:hypothetical protein